MGETVAITCPTNGAPTLASTGANGTYAANLTTSASVIDGESGRATCLFMIGSAAKPRLRVTATVAFTTAPVPHAIQRVDLRATS